MAGRPSGGGTSRLAVAALTAFVLTAGVTGVGLAADENGVVKTEDGSLKSVNGVLTYDDSNTNGQIALGNKATVYIGKGGQERAISPTGLAKDAAGGIAIGSNTYARTGSIMIGSHSYKGNLGDVQNIDTSTFDTSETGAYGFTVGSTTLGTNSFTKGMLATTIGDYNIQSGRTEGWGSSSLAYGAQNFGATVLGALNSNESATAPSIKHEDTEYEIFGRKVSIPLAEGTSYSGIANSIVGTANKVNNSNGTLVFGAGNTVKNSITDITGFSLSDSVSLKDANTTADGLRSAIKKSESGGATLVIGGGNTAENTLKTQIIGVNNTVKVTNDTPSDYEYNMIDAFNTNVENASHLYTIGTNNTIKNAKNTVLIGDNYTGYFTLSGVQDSVIIGKSSSTNAGYVPFDKVKNVVSLGNGNIMSRTDGAVAIGNDNFMKRTGAESFGYDTGNVAIGNNTYINSYVNQGDSIVIGKNATAVNMNGSLEKAFAFGTPMGKDYSGSIAIGQNAYARSGSTMIGVHNYWGNLGDLDIDYETGNEGGEGSAHIAAYQESTNATTIGNNSYNNGVFSTVMGSYTAVSGFYHNEKWGEKPYGMQNFGAAVIGSLNSVEGLSSPDYNTAGMADSILGSANRTKNANGTIMVGAGNVVEDSINDFDATKIKTKDGIESPNALSAAMRESIKNANGGGAAAVVGNGNEVTGATNVSVMGSKNILKNAKSAQIFADNREVTDTEGAVIIGSASGTTRMKTDKKNVTILGYNANVTQNDGVALGAESVADVDKGVVGYDPAKGNHDEDTTGVWKSKAAAVSVGKVEEKDQDGNVTKATTRQITNLAAGKQDTDAVNVAQLKAMNSTINNNITASKTKYYSVSAMPFTAGQLGSYAKYTNEANDGAKEIGALAAGYMTYAGGIASTVTGSLSGVINQAVTPGSLDFRGATALSYGTFNINDNTAQSGNTSGVANSIVGQANMTTDSNATLIYGAGNIVSNSYRDIDSSKMGAIADNLRNPQALGKALQDAVPSSGGQVMAFGGGNIVDNAYMTQVIGVGNTVMGNNPTKNDDGTWKSKGAGKFDDATSSQLNYVDGFYTTLINGKNDYLIGAHNTVTGDSITKNHANIVIGDNHVLENRSNNIILGSADSALSTTASNVTILGHNANVTQDDGVAIGANSVASTAAFKGTNNVGYDPTGEDHSTDTTGTWKSTAAAVSVGDAENNITRQITNVAAGTNATDAVNVAQLQKAVAGAKDGNDTLISDKNALTLNGNTLSMKVQDTAGNEVSGSVNLSDLAKAVDTNTTYTLTGKENKDNTTTITLKDNSGKENSITVATKDTRNTVKAGDHVAVAESKNNDGSSTYTVSVKTDGKVEKGNTNIVTGGTVYNETRTTADGHYTKTANTAGENILALDKQVKQNADTITNVNKRVTNLAGDVTNLNGRVSNLDNRINKVGAGAAALAALHPLDFDPGDKWNFAVGYGNYRNANSVAVGAFYRPNEDTMFNVATNFGNGENMINAGVSFKVGKGSSYTGVSKAQLVAENQRLKENDAQQDREIQELKKALEELKSRIK